MLGYVVAISALAFAVIIPLLALVKYYSPKNYSLFMNIVWFFVTVITWPLIPIVIAARRHDKLLLSLFWISFLIMAVSGWYWGVLNIQKIIQFQEQLIKGT